MRLMDGDKWFGWEPCPAKAKLFPIRWSTSHPLGIWRTVTVQSIRRSLTELWTRFILQRDFYDGAFLWSNGVGLRRKCHGVASTPTLGSSRSSSDRDDPSACDATLHASHSGPVPPPDMYLSLVRHILNNPLFWRYSG